MAALVPVGVISYRTALEARPAPDGSVFLVGKGRYQLDLPGVKIRAVAGAGPQPTDLPYVDGLYLASRPRAILETLAPSRAPATVARAFMNAELVAGGEARVIIPTVYRDDYLTGLRTLSRGGEPTPLIKGLDFAQRWVAALDWSSLAAAEAAMKATNAFARPSSAIVLRLPAAGRA